MKHSSTTRGVVSPAAKYKQVAKDCAKQIGEALQKQFDANLAKYGPLETLPAAFYPAYRRPPDLPFRSAYPLKTLSDGHGLMTHCDAVWEFTTDRDPKEAFNEIQRLMEQAGWKTTSQPKDMEPYLSMSNKSAKLEVFTRRKNGILAIDEKSPGARARPCYVRYEEPIGDVELTRAVECTLDEKMPFSVAVLFQRCWTPDQAQRMRVRLETKKPSDAEGWLMLATLYQRVGELPKAREALLKAAAMTVATLGNADLESRVQSTADSLKMSSPITNSLDAKTLESVGGIRIERGVPAVGREINLGESACFYLIQADGSPVVCTALPKAAEPPNQTSPHVTFATWSKNTKSHSSGTNLMSHGSMVSGVGDIRLEVVPLDGGRRFRVSCRITPAAPPASATTVANPPAKK